jgi:hypothetical protein
MSVFIITFTFDSKMPIEAQLPYNAVEERTEGSRWKHGQLGIKVLLLKSVSFGEVLKRLNNFRKPQHCF